MTNEEMLADLKQFIEATVSQQFALHMADYPNRDEMRSILKEEVSDLREEMNDRFDEVMDATGDTFTTAIESVDERLEDYHIRLQKLEAVKA